MIRGLAALGLLLLAVTARGETDFMALTPRERAVFHAEIRSVVLSHPELVLPDGAPPVETYSDDIANDLALIGQHAGRLFSADRADLVIGAPGAENLVAVFVSDTCPDCDRALDDLTTLSESHSLQAFALDLARHRDLAESLGVDTLPFYIFPGMMLRGHIPAPVIASYLERRTGQ